MKMHRFNQMIGLCVGAALLLGGLVGCGGAKVESTKTSAAPMTPAAPVAETASGTTVAEEQTELTILAAASLTDVCKVIKEKYEAANENVTLQFSYGSSGALQTQIEEGAPADVFMSAALKQMDALEDKGLMASESTKALLENKVVLIVPKDSQLGLTSFEELADEKVQMVGLGEPSSVPVGQYAEEVLNSLGIIEQVKAKANYGSDVRSVLTWVENGNVDCGVVYATDAALSDKVKVVCEAPEGSCKQVVYPVGIVKASQNQEAARNFISYLESEEIMSLFEAYGFAPVE